MLSTSSLTAPIATNTTPVSSLLPRAHYNTTEPVQVPVRSVPCQLLDSTSFAEESKVNHGEIYIGHESEHQDGKGDGLMGREGLFLSKARKAHVELGEEQMKS
jgi:hypothetical protein